MIFGKPPLLIYLSAKNLDFYSSEGESYIFSLTPDLVENLEVKDAEKLKENLSQFLTEKKIKKTTAIMVLADDLIFRQDILEKTPEKFQQAIKKYVEEIPLKPQKIAYKVLEYKNKYTLAGTNQELYLKFKEILRKYGFKIKFIIPLCATWIGEINLNTIKEILRDKKTLSSTNFLNNNLTTIQIKKQKTPPKNYSLLLILLIILLTAIMSAGIFYFFLSNKKKETPIRKNIPTPTIQPSPVPKSLIPKTQTVPPANKAELKIQVLNGNGGEGVAAKAKNILEKAGYQNITTGNAGKYDYEKTIIQVKENQKDLYNALLADLKNDYILEPPSKPLENKSPYDALIIIGLK